MGDSTQPDSKLILSKLQAPTVQAMVPTVQAIALDCWGPVRGPCHARQGAAQRPVPPVKHFAIFVNLDFTVFLLTRWIRSF